MSRIVRWLGAAASLALLTTGASAFEGRYDIKGASPDRQNQLQPYEGVAQIKLTGKTYSVVWKVGEVLYVGTGILRGGVLAVVFQPLNARAGPGVASYRIEDDKIIGGSWASIGSQITAEEQWTPALEARGQTF